MKKSFYLLAGIFLLGILSGCGDENFLEGLADDDSRQAKIEKAQSSLNNRDCQTALDLYTEVYGSDTQIVSERISLAAAHVCLSGFDAIMMFEVAADFGTKDIAPTQLFNKIADKTISSLSTRWDDDLGSAKGLLAASPLTSPPTPFNNDPGAGFNLAIVSLVEAIMTVADVLNFVNGVVDCAATQGSVNLNLANCVFTDTLAQEIIQDLKDASDVLGVVESLPSELADSVNEVINALDTLDGSADPSNPSVNCDDLKQYLDDQGFNIASVTCV